VRSALVAALVSCADVPFRSRTRRFLIGLSSDELQFIAEFLGSCILESARRSRCTRAQLSERISEFQHTRTGLAPCSPDQEHKMILLLEFLCRSTLQQLSIPVRAGQVS
jgi:hypothetical protein